MSHVLDVARGDLPPGTYALDVAVADGVSGATVTASRQAFVVRPAS